MDPTVDPRVFPQLPIPFIVRRRFILPWSFPLPECSPPLACRRRRRRFDSQRFRVPSTTSLGLAPCEPECPNPARFRSQVFSTSQRFPSTPELCGLVACRCRPWDPSLQSFPLGEDRLPLSGLPAPLQSSTGVLRRAARRRSPPGFPDSHALAQLPGSPRDYGLPFRGPKPASRSSWAPLSRTASFRQLHLLRSLSSPRRVRSRSHRVTPMPPADALLGVAAPPELSLLHLGSSTRLDPEVQT